MEAGGGGWAQWHAEYLTTAWAPWLQVVLIGVAADSGCGKSTFMRRLTNIFGGENVSRRGCLRP